MSLLVLLIRHLVVTFSCFPVAVPRGLGSDLLGLPLADPWQSLVGDQSILLVSLTIKLEKEHDFKTCQCLNTGVHERDGGGHAEISLTPVFGGFYNEGKKEQLKLCMGKAPKRSYGKKFA
uniref:Secreted protein n=1 Tax=Romanomermis culicivorax TaxID=13658 RepID=A0A915K403_ROMCU